MDIMEILNSVMDKLKKVGGAELSFGNSQTVGDLTIIPIAKVVYGFGGGSGPAGGRRRRKKEKVHAIDETSEEMIESEHHEHNEQPKPEEMGMGAGGGMKTVPLGIFVFKGEKVRFYPVISFQETGVTIAIIFVILWKLFRNK
jgi:uncharacterized spore protein YtfJ